jgi:hypothetical protein
MVPEKEDPLGFCRGVTNALMIEAVIAGLVGIGFLIYQTFIR